MSHSIPLAEGEMLESFIFHSLTAIPQQHDLELKQRVTCFDMFVGICSDCKFELGFQTFSTHFHKKNWSHGLVVSVDSMWENVSKKLEKYADCWEVSGHQGTPGG